MNGLDYLKRYRTEKTTIEEAESTGDFDPAEEGWLQFKSELQEGDEFWAYEEMSHEGLGSGGYFILRDREVWLNYEVWIG